MRLKSPRASFLGAPLLLLAISLLAVAKPAGFSWVNLETDKATMATVRRALQGVTVTAIREVGVKDGYALVMTTWREDDNQTPDYDEWSVWSVSLATAKRRLLVEGYGVKWTDWLGAERDELAITYYDCRECEPATIFTTLHIKPGSGWQARWPGKQAKDAPSHPGALVQLTDVGEPYDDTVAEQVFAVVKQPNDSFAAGFWLHTRDTKSGKIEDSVTRYSVDPSTGQDRIEELSGPAALEWKRQICKESNLLTRLNHGQDSKACKRILQPSPR